MSARKPREGFFRRSLRLVPKVLRLAVFIVFAWVVAVVWAANRVEAEVQEIMLGLGGEMMQMPDADTGRLRQMNFNGAPIQFRTSHTDKPMAEVLDYFEGRCQERDGRLAEQLEELMEQEPRLEGLDPEELDGTMRFDTSQRGYVACLDMGEERQDHEDIINRVGEFIQTGDIADVGHMRYLYAQRVEDDQTFFVTVFSDHPVNIYEMFPTEGDAPGRDPEDVARPPGARRLLSAWEDGKPYGMFVYTDGGGSSAEATEETYRTELMPERGWAQVQLRDGERVQVDGTYTSVWEKGERLVTLVFAESEQGETTTSILTSDEEP